MHPNLENWLLEEPLFCYSTLILLLDLMKSVQSGIAVDYIPLIPYAVSPDMSGGFLDVLILEYDTILS